MANLNKVMLIGNLTRDPELKYTPGNQAVCEVGLAVNRKYRTKEGEEREETTFVDVTFWSRDAEIIGEYVTKGTPLMVEGRLKLDTWEKDGKKNSKLRVIGERFVLLGGRDGGGPRGSGEEGVARPKRAAGGRPNAPSGADHDAEPVGGGGDSHRSMAGSDDDIPF